MAIGAGVACVGPFPGDAMTAFRSPLLGCSVAAACILLLSLGACSPSGRQEPAATVAATADAASPARAVDDRKAMAATRWRCGDVVVATHFDDALLESITIQTPERTLTLKSMANEDGVRFADAAGNEFWSRPGKVNLTQVGQATVECRKERG
jgi:hypothetical protein